MGNEGVLNTNLRQELFSDLALETMCPWTLIPAL